jgi:type IV pilus assembly protein PilC
MFTYKYTAKDKSGRTISGTVEGASQNEAAESLHKKELVVLSILESKSKTSRSLSGAVKLDDLVIFSRQLATMIDAGIPLVQSLAILTEQIDNKRLRSVVGILRQDIEAGMSFCDALAKHPAIFSELFINMSRAGETSGMLDEVLDRLANYLEKTASLNRKIKSSLVYPAVIVSMAGAITAVLLIKVVPTFKGIFEVLGGTLPLPTLILIAVSDMVRKYFFICVLAIALMVVALKKYAATQKGRYKLDEQILKLPILGPLFRKVALVKFSRTFATLMKSGVAVLAALDIVAKTSGNKVIEEAVLNCRVSVSSGEPISKPLSKSGIFPPMVCRMISVGEQTGKLEKMLTKVADFYDEQVDAAVTALTSLIEPIVIAFLGIVIGGIVIALFLPVFKITQLIAT